MNQVLFLCSGNYYRSRYAEEVFNYQAQVTGIDWRAISRGIRLNPNNKGPIAGIVPRQLARQGIKPINLSRAPEALTNTDLANAALVVAMSRQEHRPLMANLFPSYAEAITYWDVEDSDAMSPDVAFRRTDLAVDRLVGVLGLSKTDVTQRNRFQYPSSSASSY